jgi:hypothetical protein
MRGNPHYRPSYGDYHQDLEWYEPSPENRLRYESAKRKLAQTAYRYHPLLTAAAVGTVLTMTAHDYWAKQAAEEQRKLKTGIRERKLALLNEQMKRLSHEVDAPQVVDVTEPAVTTTRPVTSTMVHGLPKYDVRAPAGYTIRTNDKETIERNAFAESVLPYAKSMGLNQLLEEIKKNHPKHAKWFVPMFGSEGGLQRALNERQPFPRSWLDIIKSENLQRRIIEQYSPTLPSMRKTAKK